MALTKIGTDSIKDDAVTSAKIPANAVTQSEVNFPVANRNLIINGAMQVAQRGTSSTSDGYQTVDRFQVSRGGVDEAPTQAQVDVSSGTTPYTEGFRKALKVTNGNQTGGAGTSDNIIIRYKAEAQDIANSGWNYTSSSSFITFSFWIKSSVAQEFQITLVSVDGSSYVYPTETPSLSANTWTKVTKTISGNSNLSFDNNNGEGLRLIIVAYCGSDYSTDSATENAWNAYSSGNQFGRASTSTWYTTNDATLEITGVQLEVGSTATDFEHRSYGQELALARRYYFGNVGNGLFGVGRTTNASTMWSIQFPTEMRVNPSMSLTSTTVTISEPNAANFNVTSATVSDAHGGTTSKAFYLNGTMSVSTGDNLFLTTNYLKFDAEL